MRKWSSVWFLSVWVILGFLMLLSGFISNRVDNIVLSVFVFAVASVYLTSQVKSERRVKKALEIIFMLFSFGVAVYGYILTGSLVLGVITLLFVAMIFFAFLASYLLPKIRSKSESIVKHFEEWFRGYDSAPLWISFCRLIFAVSTLTFIISFFGPAILGGDLIGFWMYQKWNLTHAGFLYVIVIVVAFALTVIFGIPTFLYEKRSKPMKNEE